MFAEQCSYLLRCINTLQTLSPSTFQSLTGLLLIVALLRFLLPLHRMMTREMYQRNEIVDQAEAEGCTEFDIFAKALTSYYGRGPHHKAHRDFVAYLSNWPDNYVLPYYVRLYLKTKQLSAPAESDKKPKVMPPSQGRKLPARMADSG